MLFWVWSDDSQRLADLTAAAESVGSRVRTFTDAEELLTKIVKIEPKLVVLDASQSSSAAMELVQKIHDLGLLNGPAIWLWASRETLSGLSLFPQMVDGALSDPLCPFELSTDLRRFERISELESELEDSQARGSHDAQRLSELNELLNYASRRFQDLFERIPVACFSCDLEGNVFEWNQASERLYGYHAAEAMQKSIFSLIYAAERSDDFRQFFGLIRRGGFTEASEQVQVNRDGQSITVVMEVSEVKGQNGETTALLFACNDITDRKKMERALEGEILKVQEYAVRLEFQQKELEAANAKLELLATTDGLTGLANNRHFRVTLANELERAHRYGADFSVVLMDVDFFKQFNDTYGHLAGDDVLRQVSQVLKSQVREVDLAARYGGEEFVILLPEAGMQAAVQAAERIRAAIEAAPWELRGVTVSVGVATLSMMSPESSDLVQAADDALYAAKRSGRNRVVHSSSLPLAPAEAA